MPAGILSIAETFKRPRRVPLNDVPLRRVQEHASWAVFCGKASAICLSPDPVSRCSVRISLYQQRRKAKENMLTKLVCGFFLGLCYG